MCSREIFPEKVAFDLQAEVNSVLCSEVGVELNFGLTLLGSCHAILHMPYISQYLTTG